MTMTPAEVSRGILDAIALRGLSRGPGNLHGDGSACLVQHAFVVCHGMNSNYDAWAEEMYKHIPDHYAEVGSLVRFSDSEGVEAVRAALTSVIEAE
jgi:hypothetical protein